MKKILILSSGDVGTHFIQRVIDTYTSENIYYVVELKAKEYERVNPSRFKFFEFDPTSIYKLSNILKMEFIQVLIAMDNKADVENTIKNIKMIKKHLRVVVMDEWGLSYEDGSVVFINAKDILASKLIDFLPNVPVIAQNVGLGEGEVMEVSVPFGSSFVYKHLGVIQQKNWKIAAIYRNRELLLPTRRRMIQPNDILLLVGEPQVLKTVYRVIKRELGQFPEPFGTSLYLYVDMTKNDPDSIRLMLMQAKFIQEKLAKELFIRIVNPNDIELLEEIKSQSDLSTFVDVLYEGDRYGVVAEDKKRFHVGFVLVSNEIFFDTEMRKILYGMQVPVLKLSQKPFEQIKEAALIVSESRESEKISNAIFDFSEQFDLKIELYNFIKEHQEIKEQVIEHYYNLSAIFSKNIKVFKEEENPIRVLKSHKNFLHFVPFSKKLTKRVFYSYFSTDSDLMYHHLEDFHQMFIPVDNL